MRCDRLYLDEVVNTQGDIFGIAHDNGYDIIRFGEYYLKSDVRSYIDSGIVEYCTLGADNILKLLNVDISKKVNIEIDKKEREKVVWIGKFYAICQWCSNISSSTLVTKVRAEDVYEYHKVLSSMDMEIAAKLYLRNVNII